MELGTSRIVVVGGGLAGASTAYHLARRGARRVTLLEQEATCGAHASGRNAAMIRQVVADASVGALAQAGAAFLKSPPGDWEVPLCFEQNGSLLLGAGPALDALARQAAAARDRGVPAEPRDAEEIRRRVPLLERAAFDGGVWCAGDGVVDVSALLGGFLAGARKAGAAVRTGAIVRGIAVQGGRVAGVETSEGTLAADIVVNAAGAWARELGRRAGAADIPLRPCRRHLFSTGPVPGIDRRWPFVWDIGHEFYFRPESGGLLLSPCDEDDFPPGDTPADAAAQSRLAEKLTRYAPRLANLPVRKGWAGLRTLTPDGRFVVGWDPNVEGFFWVAGLGGHGVTCSASVGALAARVLAGEANGSAAAFEPGRFAAASETQARGRPLA